MITSVSMLSIAGWYRKFWSNTCGECGFCVWCYHCWSVYQTEGWKSSVRPSYQSPRRSGNFSRRAASSIWWFSRLQLQGQELHPDSKSDLKSRILDRDVLTEWPVKNCNRSSQHTFSRFAGTAFCKPDHLTVIGWDELHHPRHLRALNPTHTVWLYPTSLEKR